MVRIQTERGRQVVTNGPYQWIRHPGYAGALLAYWATPLQMDSRWTCLPVVFITIVLIIRTHLEDRTLHDELVGYSDYKRRVPYRLIPRVC
jgi:protein-S-isoprenylcysteine O-methyltransferase Ste14